jgi:hypothetical protein
VNNKIIVVQRSTFTKSKVKRYNIIQNKDKENEKAIILFPRGSIRVAKKERMVEQSYSSVAKN